MSSSRKRFILIIGVITVIIGAAVAFGLLRSTPSQANDNIHTIGVVNVLPAPVSQDFLNGLQAGMTANGYTAENTTYIFSEVPTSRDPAELQTKINAVLENPLDVVVCISTSACVATKQATTLPVVFMAVTDPVDAGLVADFTQPGSNITGVASAARNSVNQGRALEWLTTIFPDVEQVFIPYNPQDSADQARIRALQTAAEQLGIELLTAEITSLEEAETAFANFPEAADAIITFPDRFYTEDFMQNRISALAIERKLPHLSYSVEFGQLMAYNVQEAAVGEQAAQLVDRILKGAQPAELPIEVPEFVLSINLDTAEAMGIEIAEEYLRQAEVVAGE